MAEALFAAMDYEGNSIAQFESREDVGPWIARQRNEWSWLAGVADKVVANRSLVQQWRSKANSAFTRIETAVKQSHKDPQLDEQLKNYWLPSTSDPRVLAAKKIGEWPEEKAEDRAAHSEALLEACAFLTVTLKRHDDHLAIEFSSASQLRGAFLGLAFDEGISPEGSKAARESILENHEEFCARLAEINSAWAKQVTEVGGFLAKSQKDHSNETDAWKSRLDEFQADIDKLRNDYETGFSLKSPKDYWVKKAERHEDGFRKWMGGFAGGVGLLVVALSIAWACWASDILRANQDVKGIGAYWPIAALAVITGILVWPIRMVARVANSHMHLAEDARERQVMVEMYLAMLQRDDKAITEGERVLVLQALFRPSPTGFVKDEIGGPPLNAAELLIGKGGGQP